MANGCIQNAALLVIEGDGVVAAYCTDACVYREEQRRHRKVVAAAYDRRRDIQRMCREYCEGK